MTGLRSFDTLLVANRGEIACRILRSAAALGLHTVAVYSDPDRPAPHVRMADRAVRLGPAPPRESYLRAEAVVQAALDTGSGAVHPGYGFLSEDAEFAHLVEDAGLVFVGPRPETLELFGSKHRSRTSAAAAGVPVADGTGLLADPAAALEGAEALGYPVMLKSTGGGGGIGMEPCRDPRALEEAFERVQRVAQASFRSAGMFLERMVERARHVEVQVVGDGRGQVVTLGDRDCTMQRRRQKVLEEAPAPGLAEGVRAAMLAGARTLCESVAYRSAGTVEFLYDVDRRSVGFLEVNPRLQVEHLVTEAVWGVDLVTTMLRIADGDDAALAEVRAARPTGHAVEVRLCAEDPVKGFLPSPGLVTAVSFPTEVSSTDGSGPGAVRVDSWIEAGSEVSAAYDPLLAKLVVHRASRDAALDALLAAVDATSVSGIETNRGLLRAALSDARLRRLEHTTGTLALIDDPSPRIDVLRPGTSTGVQAWPGRIGYWEVGVPPSGPMDDRSFRLGNLAVGNPEGAAGLEATFDGPALRFSAAAVVCLTGAECAATLDGEPVELWRPVAIAPGQTLDVGAIGPPGLRTYVLVSGGIAVPAFLGSGATFDLGRFGGHGGRTLRAGDVLRPGDGALPTVVESSTASGGDRRIPRDGVRPPGAAHDPQARPVDPSRRPPMSGDWEVAVLDGPHGAPEFFTPADIDAFYSTSWEVHFNSARTGVRLRGPRPQWARPDGGDAGLHPSNIHDTAYSVGSVDYTGDLPILLGPDGPSLGGFVCPATVITAERWKLGQLRPGDRLRFVAVSPGEADELRRSTARLLGDSVSPASLEGAVGPGRRTGGHGPPGRSTGAGWPERTGGRGGARRAGARAGGRDPGGGVVVRREATGSRPEVVFRRCGDDNLMVEYGPMTLDLGLRARVHVLTERVRSHGLDGLVDLTPGIRSLQIHVDPAVVSVERVLDVVGALDDDLPRTEDLEVPSREVFLPLSWDDPATREAIARYMAGVRDDAPWCPWNIEFIRRVNGLADVGEVRRIVYDASYLVLGLGDVYLGAPVATPLDPRHRLVTTKYNPARTWTAENSVGIGGAYLCIYGMEGPGGYQFVGRTVQVWSRFRQSPPFEPGVPWLLRFFDRIRWFPVEADELLDARADLAAGRLDVRIDPGVFRLADYERMLAAEAETIERFRATQSEAFARERAAWAAAGEFEPREEAVVPPARSVTAPAGGFVVGAPMLANVWKIDVRPGDRVAAGQVVAVLEAMKIEVAVPTPVDGVVLEVLCGPGSQVAVGAPIVVLGRP